MASTSHLAEGALLQGGKYRIVRFIGAGGFGCTYEAVFEMLGVRVAIKEFFPQEFCNRDATGHVSVGAESQRDFLGKMRKKFVNEAYILYCNKDIDGVVKVTDVFDENGTSYYVMDYIEGQSLQSLLKASGAVAESVALRIIKEAGSALQRVHERKWLHLDIKPDNIMLSSDGRPVLIDFGVSKQFSIEDGCETSTLAGYTPGYAPLEQYNGNVKALKPAADVYALGATLYALLTGHRPPKVIDLANEEEELAFPSGISNATRRAIEEAMRMKPKDRPADVSSFLSMLPGSSTAPKLAPAAQKPSPAPKPTPAPTPSKTQIVGGEAPAKSTAGDERMIGVALFAIALIILVVCINTLPSKSSASGWDAIPADTAAIADFTTPEMAEDHVQATAQMQSEPEDAPAAQASEPVQPVVAPASSKKAETAMIAAYTDGGEYRTYTVADWDSFSAAQRAKVQPVGVQLSASGQKFIIAPTDAGGGKGFKWEDNNFYSECVDITRLQDITAESKAKQDFYGAANTNFIRVYGGENGITFPAANTAVNYSAEGQRLNWCLPAAGQLWLMYENKTKINKALNKIGQILDGCYWSSTEYNSVYAWCVSMAFGNFGYNYKYYTNRVRPVAPAGVS